jgi:hypothetical protein
MITLIFLFFLLFPFFSLASFSIFLLLRESRLSIEGIPPLEELSYPYYTRSIDLVGTPSLIALYV